MDYIAPIVGGVAALIAIIALVVNVGDKRPAILLGFSARLSDVLSPVAIIAGATLFGFCVSRFFEAEAADSIMTVGTAFCVLVTVGNVATLAMRRVALAHMADDQRKAGSQRTNDSSNHGR